MELERLHNYNLVLNSLKARQALTKAEKETGIMEIVPEIDIGSVSEAW